MTRNVDFAAKILFAENMANIGIGAERFHGNTIVERFDALWHHKKGYNVRRYNVPLKSRCREGAWDGRLG